MLGTKPSYAAEEAGVVPSTVTAVGQARLDDLHRQAQHDALIRAARRARRGQQHSPRQQSGHRVPGLLAAATRWARRPGPAPGSS
jgi:hypothetical protein